MKNNYVTKLTLLVFTFLCSFFSWGQVFQYDFTSGTTPSVDNAVGTPSFSIVGAVTNNTATCNGNALSHTAWDANDAYRFTVNTTGYENLEFSYFDRCSNTSIGTFLVRVSTDGTTWTTLRSAYTPGTSACNSSGNLAIPSTFSNISNLFIEIYKINNAGATGNVYRLDDVTLVGTVVSSSTPEINLQGNTKTSISKSNKNMISQSLAF